MYKVSVIVPVFNVEKYIEKCVRALFQQTLKEVEYIFVNDCTQDRSIDILKQILKEYPNRSKDVKIIEHECNKGLPSARLTGLQYAVGEYVIHSDSDDWMEKEMLEVLYHSAKNADADCVYCDFWFITEKGKERYKTAEYSTVKASLLNNWINTRWTVIWNLLVKKSIYNNDIEYPVSIQFCEDFYLAVQLLCLSEKIVQVQQPLHNYNRLNVSSILHTARVSKMESDALWAYSNIITYLKRNKFIGFCEESISWRFLNAVQGLVLNDRTFLEFKNAHPETHKFIWSCPYLNKKIKFMMWCLDRNLDFIVFIIVYLRRVFKR